MNLNQEKIIKVAILAEEPLGWGSGKHYFSAILDDYKWNVGEIVYKFSTRYIYDKDILHDKLNNSDYDVLLVPGGGVGDGEAIVKGFNIFRNVNKWKKKIGNFIVNGGGYVGICGGAALLTDLKTKDSKKSKTFWERQYDKSSLGISCVSSYYNCLTLPFFNLFHEYHPEKIGAMGYVFSFSPGVTIDGKRFFASGIPIDFQINKDNPIFYDYENRTVRMRWWGGPALVLPKNPDRNVKILAKYPAKEISDDKTSRIYAWRYIGGIPGLLKGFFKALKFIKKEKESLKNLLIYTYYFIGNWRKTDNVIELDFSGKSCMTAEIYPNLNEGRIFLCTTHPEYMIWYGGYIEEVKGNDFNCIARGLHQWKNIDILSRNAEKEFTHSWWIIRRMVAWAGKIPDDDLPPISVGEITDKGKKILFEDVFWNGKLKNQIKNI